MTFDSSLTTALQMQLNVLASENTWDHLIYNRELDSLHSRSKCHIALCKKHPKHNHMESPLSAQSAINVTCKVTTSAISYIKEYCK